MKAIYLLFLICIFAITSCIQKSNSQGGNLSQGILNDSISKSQSINTEDAAFSYLKALLRKNLDEGMNKDCPPEEVSILIEDTCEGRYHIGFLLNSYTFELNSSRYLRGDVNLDGREDLIIKGIEQRGATTEYEVYFLFLNSQNGYDYIKKYDSSDIAAQSYCGDDHLEYGRFYLNKIRDGYFIGNSVYHGGEESIYGAYSYSCDKEVYKLDEVTRDLYLVSHSEIVKNEDENQQ